MRTLTKILDAANGNKPLTVEEGRYALCAMSGLCVLDGLDMDQDDVDRHLALRRTERWQRVLSMDPRKHLGWENDPANPKFQTRRAHMRKIVEGIKNGKTKP